MYELPVYTARELDMGARFLPGYRYPGDLSEVTAARAWWDPVLSVSVFRRHPSDPERLQTWTGVRDSSTHDDVVSTITGTFPAAFQQGLVDNKALYQIKASRVRQCIGAQGPNPQRTGVLAAYRPNVQHVPNTSDPLPYLCHDILARKLGGADLVQMRFDDENLGKVSLVQVAIGVSYVDDDPRQGDEPLYEALVMYGATLMLNDVYRDALPTRTDSYKYLGWTDTADTFPEDVRAKRVMRLAPYLPELETAGVCARGFCLQTTSDVVQSEYLRGHLGLPPRSEAEELRWRGLSPLGELAVDAGA